MWNPYGQSTAFWCPSLNPCHCFLGPDCLSHACSFPPVTCRCSRKSIRRVSFTRPLLFAACCIITRFGLRGRVTIFFGCSEKDQRRRFFLQTLGLFQGTTVGASPDLSGKPFSSRPLRPTRFLASRYSCSFPFYGSQVSLFS